MSLFSEHPPSLPQETSNTESGGKEYGNGKWYNGQNKLKDILLCFLILYRILELI